MKRSHQFLFGLILFASLASIASAHPGRTDAYGCHTCNTNCADWGLSKGEYHCHNAKAIPQPKSPIRSHYGTNGTGTTEYWPEYESARPSAAPTPTRTSIPAPATPITRTPSAPASKPAPMPVIDKKAEPETKIEQKQSTIPNIPAQNQPTETSPFIKGFFKRMLLNLFM